jgi:signal transduction histidine kinase/DNA-binding response OmpR family regulator
MRLPNSLRDGLSWLSSHRSMAWLACCAAVATCFAAICIFAWFGARADAERQADETASSIANVVERDIARNIELFDRALQTASDGLQVPGIWEISPQMRNLVLFDRASALRYLAFIEILDENGDVIADPQPTKHATNWASREYFVAHQRDPSLGIYVSRPFAADHEELASISLSRRIAHPDGTFAGVAVAGVRLGYFRDLFSRLTVGPHGSITLLGSDGVVLMRMPFDRNDTGRTVDSRSPFADVVRTGAARMAALDPLDHVLRRFAVQQIGDLPLAVSVGLASEDIGSDSQNRLRTILVSGVALFLLSTGLIGALQRELWLRKAAERDNKNKSRYLAATSHELRTPLHSILGNADRLRASPDLDPDDARHVVAIACAGEHLRSVIDRVLNYLEIESRAPSPRMSRVDVRYLLDQCRAIVEPSATARGLALRCMVKAGGPRHFITDDALLRLVLLNLLGNAVKFTRQGEVVVEASGTEERIAIEVKDTGCGIPVEQRRKLFVEFERLGAEKAGIEGSGLGLAMVRRIVTSMGGDSGYRERPGGGSVFWFALPAGTLPDEAVPPSKPSKPSKSMLDRALSVLLVDDEVMNRELAACILHAGGHAVIEARDGREAVRLAAANDFDVVLMDMRMPDMDGLEAARQIRAIAGPRGRVPIIAVTANALNEQIAQSRAAGMVEHLVKPFTADALSSIVARVAARFPIERPVQPAGFDPRVLEQLAMFMSAEAIDQQLRELSRRIETLLQLMAESDGNVRADALADVAHGLAGSAGTYGFTALSAAARQFDTAIPADPAQAAVIAGGLARVARAALAKLRERFLLEPADAG